ncbi:MAG TPA: SOS response-associated peptidase [Solirubrobacterales bacterium]|jgi:putative SOS response-associated peptidase YedK
MCGRYTLANPDPNRIKLRFELPDETEIDERPRFNIAPTDPVLAVRERAQRRELGTLRWGLIPGKWALEKKGPPLINARAESLERQPAFAESFRERRCLIPADGFYEWRRDERGKVPIWFSRPDGDLFAFAGIWARYEPRDSEPIASCALITCAPNELMRPIHDRMPVVLDPEAEELWISDTNDIEALLEVLRPAPEDALVMREVNDFVNDVRKDGPELIAPRDSHATLF